MIEKEIKTLLLKDQYINLKKLFEWGTPFIQINYYYGNKHGKYNDITVRIRNINDRFYLQVKIPMRLEGSLHIKREYEIPYEGVVDILDRNILNELVGEYFDEDLRLMGKLKTERLICNNFNNVEISLDKSFYFDHIDYEIEIEYKEKYPKDIIDRLTELGISFENSTKGKSTRFVERLMLLDERSAYFQEET